jgi:AAA+ superfamily predicted ATPase
VVDLSADEAAARAEETLAALEAELIGLTSVKRRVREIASLLQVDRARRQFGLTTSKPTLHTSFAGGPGTGKTTVAMRMATILHALGYIRAPRVHAVTRDDLVGQFIGHTATKEALARAAVACSSSTRPTSCSVPKTSGTTGRKPSRCCCR